MLALGLPRRAVGALVLAGSLGILGWLWFGESDEQRVVRALYELADVAATRENENVAFRTARLNGAFEDRLTPSVVLEAPELGRAQGIREIAVLAAGAPRAYGDFDLDVGETEVNVNEAIGRARATSRVTVSGGRAGELRRDTRTVTFHLTKQGGDWLVDSIAVGAGTDEEPEARP